MSNSLNRQISLLEQEKLQAEIEKINAEKLKVDEERAKATAETADLNRAWWKRYQFWSSVTPAVLAIFTLLFALATNFFSTQRDLLKIEEAKLTDSTVHLQKSKDSLGKEFYILQNQFNALKNNFFALARQVHDDTILLGTTKNELNNKTIALSELKNQLGGPQNVIEKKQNQIVVLQNVLIKKQDSVELFRRSNRNLFESLDDKVGNAQQKTSDCRARLQAAQDSLHRWQKKYNSLVP